MPQAVVKIAAALGADAIARGVDLLRPVHIEQLSRELCNANRLVRARG
jgi:hypothetical protein